MSANKGALHPNDWHAFYGFVRKARRSNIAEADLIKSLMKDGFRRCLAVDLATTYRHCWAVLNYPFDSPWDKKKYKERLNKELGRL
jgi:hypothetical protein